jgi:hypothetical protein
MTITLVNPLLFVSVFIAVGIAFGAICGHIAQARGHDRVTWIVLGFFFGLVALVVLALLPEGKIDRKQCPDCLSPVLADARVCRHCSYRFAGPA